MLVRGLVDVSPCIRDIAASLLQTLYHPPQCGYDGVNNSRGLCYHMQHAEDWLEGLWRTVPICLGLMTQGGSSRHTLVSMVPTSMRPSRLLSPLLTLLQQAPGCVAPHVARGLVKRICTALALLSPSRQYMLQTCGRDGTQEHVEGREAWLDFLLE